MIINSYITKNAKPEVIQKRHIDIARAINGGLEFGSPIGGLKNVLGFWVDIVTPGADVEFTVNHNLQYIPTGIIVFSVDKAAVIYASRKSQWTTTQAFYKANLASVSLTAFVL
jgi:hypothetical protein